MSVTWYLDSSAIMAPIYGEEGKVDLGALQPAGTSDLARVECLLSLDRRRLRGKMDDARFLESRSAVQRIFRTLRTAAIDAAILERAAAPSTIPLRALDAIHLATALLWREESGEEIRFVTHDRRLADAARAHGFEVLGV